MTQLPSTDYGIHTENSQVTSQRLHELCKYRRKWYIYQHIWKKNRAVLMSAIKRPDQSSSPWARAGCQDCVSWHITSPSTSTCPNTYSVNCQPTCVGGELCSDGAPEIGLQGHPKADIWLMALKRLSQPRLDFYKWLACFLHLFVTSKSRITIIFKDYLLLMQPEPLFRDQDHLAQTQNKRQSLLQKFTC